MSTRRDSPNREGSDCRCLRPSIHRAASARRTRATSPAANREQRKETGRHVYIPHRAGALQAIGSFLKSLEDSKVRCVSGPGGGHAAAEEATWVPRSHAV